MLTIHAGLGFASAFPLPGFPAASGWALSGRLVNTSRTIDVAADCFTGSGSAWALRIPAAVTAGYAAGDYSLMLIATDSTGAVLAGTVRVRVAAAGVGDLRSDARKALDEMDAILAGKASQDHSELTIDGRSIKRMAWRDLLLARAHFAGRVDAEERELRGAKSQLRKIPVRFHDAS